MDAAPVIDAVIAAAEWRAAKHWLGVWAGAGFVAKLRDGVIYLPPAWEKEFPDGPLLIGAIRDKFVAILAKVSPTSDPKLAVAYYRPEFIRHLGERIKDDEWRLRRTRFERDHYPESAEHCERLIVTLEAKLAGLRKQLADQKKPGGQA